MLNSLQCTGWGARDIAILGKRDLNAEGGKASDHRGLQVECACTSRDSNTQDVRPNQPFVDTIELLSKILILLSSFGHSKSVNHTPLWKTGTQAKLE